MPLWTRHKAKDNFTDRNAHAELSMNLRRLSAVLDLTVFSVLLIGASARCVSQISAAPNTNQDVIQSKSTVVLVPALVRTKSGDIVYTLHAEDFQLMDDGIAQPLHLVPDTGNEPLALVLVLEVGSAASRQFRKYERIASPLAPMLASIVGNVEHEIALITFDGLQKVAQPFTSDLEEAEAALEQLQPGVTRQQDQHRGGWHPFHGRPSGEDGAATLDALEAAVGMLRDQPAAYRRAILLVSETLDRGSHTSVEEAVRAITDSNTTIYSIGFSSPRPPVAHEIIKFPTKSRGASAEDHKSTLPNSCMGENPNSEPEIAASRRRGARDYHPDSGTRSAVSAATIDDLESNIPETVARLTGGEYFKLGSEREFENDLVTISNHLPNRYLLSFHPLAPHPGLHRIALSLPSYEGLEITVRTSYWTDEVIP